MAIRGVIWHLRDGRLKPLHERSLEEALHRAPQPRRFLGAGRAFADEGVFHLVEDQRRPA
jgi:hypothetical protein